MVEWLAVTNGLFELTGSSHTPFVVVEDPKVGQHTHEARAQLRSLPLLWELGFEHFLHDPLWENGFQMVNYDYWDPNDVEVKQLPYPLVHIVSQEGLLKNEISDGEITRDGEQHVMRDILRTRDEDDIYIIVTDTNSPELPAVSTQRPVTDEYSPVTTVNYPNFVEKYVRENLNSALPLQETRNYFFHKVSDHHREVGASANSLVGLFDYDTAPPKSPVWEPLYYFVEHDLQTVLEMYTERIRETLRSWLERGDVQKIANEMDAMLTRCEYQVEQLDEQRKQNMMLYE